jgi:hypothetical protein
LAFDAPRALVIIECAWAPAANPDKLRHVAR